MRLKLLLHLLKKSATRSADRGFVLPMTIALGMVMLILGLTGVMLAQSDRNIATSRQQANSSLTVAEGAADRVLSLLSNRNNLTLLGRDYDPINPKTNRNYLGKDGLVDSGDEGTIAIDEWAWWGEDPSTFPCFQQARVEVPTLPLSGTLGNGGSYRLLAYRYDPQQRLGHLLVEGTHNDKTATVLISFQVTPDLQNFPGVVVQRDDSVENVYDSKLILRGRSIRGSHANVYYTPQDSGDATLTGISNPGDSTRPSYLNAVWSAPGKNLDGATGDNISGKLFACNLDISDFIDYNGYTPDPEMLPNLGVINSSRTITGVAGTVSSYMVERIELSGNQTLTVDTTAGPVHLFLRHPGPNWANFIASSLHDTAKIVNIRTDGVAPRTGDLRILSNGNTPLSLHDQSCVENAFLYSKYDNLVLLTTGPGCPNTPNANFVGVVWAEAIVSSKNHAANRNQDYYGYIHDVTITPGATSGIVVPEDVSSVYDLLKHTRIPIRYQIGPVRNWQQVQQVQP